MACIAGMEHLQSQRLEVAKAMKEEEAERVRIEQDMAVLQSRLAHIKESLQKKVNATSAYEAADLAAQVAGSTVAFAGHEASLCRFADMRQMSCAASASVDTVQQSDQGY